MKQYKYHALPVRRTLCTRDAHDYSIVSTIVDNYYSRQWYT